MKELKEETSTQKLYWDSENEIVWGELFAHQVTEEHAKEDPAQPRHPARHWDLLATLSPPVA